MDIVVIRDDIYPIFNNEDKIVLLLGNHQEFISNFISKINIHALFYCKYSIIPDETGTLNVSIIESSHKIRGRYINVEEFISLLYPIQLCSKYTYKNDTDHDKMFIHDIIFFNNTWVRILFIEFLGIIDKQYETCIINPYLVRDNYKIFKNILLSSIINNIIFDKNSTLIELINKLYTRYHIDKYRMTCIVKYNDYNNIKLIYHCYNRNKFNAFIYAWFRSQITRDSIEENEKVERMFNNISKRI
ncbi:virion protein [Swinepox virus]|uniref:Virion protein n=1 Tax=Swinepox virus TaxID=10276 RepID=A0A881SY54_SWPV|nr:virion protein [Swinepox virus]